jgi:hypothetical protein
MIWPATEQFVKFRTMPVVCLAECPLCGARFLAQKNRVICWSHYELLFGVRYGGVPQHEVTDDVTRPIALR